jgi:hypothetical protein
LNQTGVSGLFLKRNADGCTYVLYVRLLTTSILKVTEEKVRVYRVECLLRVCYTQQIFETIELSGEEDKNNNHNFSQHCQYLRWMLT